MDLTDAAADVQQRGPCRMAKMAGHELLQNGDLCLHEEIMVEPDKIDRALDGCLIRRCVSVEAAHNFDPGRSEIRCADDWAGTGGRLGRPDILKADGLGNHIER